MIASKVLTVPAGAVEVRATGLSPELLPWLRDCPPRKMPYLSEIRVIVPEAIPTWRVDGLVGGGQIRGIWWNWSTSNAATRILPLASAGDPTADWQQIHAFPGIPLSSGGDDCSFDWVSSTQFRFVSAVAAPAAYNVMIIYNVVKHINLVT